MAEPPLLLLTDIHATFGTTPLLAGASLSVAPGERVALVGRNGSGKSSLLRVAAGLHVPDSGTRFLQPGTTLRYLEQEPDLSAYPDVEAYVMAGLGPADPPHLARQWMTALGLSGDEAPARLSGGEARRAALARVLAPDPDVLLLDEPTNHLDLPAIEWLEGALAAYRGALVVISHDRRFLERLSRAMVWLDRGTTRRLERGFAHFEEWRDTVLEEEERDAHKLARKIVREEHWLRYGVTARRKRNVKRLAGLGTLREKHRERLKPQGVSKLAASNAEMSGNLVIEARGIEKHYDKPVVREFSTRIMRGDRVGIVGPNGAGKSTLLAMLTGRLAPDSGEVRLGAMVSMQVLDQARAELDSNRTLADVLTGGAGEMVEVNGERRHVVGYMKDFLFLAEQARTPVRLLSGGERGRLLLARALAAPANLLVLDEPTNDLDLETLDLLQELLAEHPGTVIVVSHDRDFLDRVCGSVIAFEGDGRWQEYAGGYSDMVAQRGHGVQGAARAVETRTAPAAPRAEAPAARRMSFKDQHALATLPAAMEKLQAEITVIRGWLADPDLYTRDPAGFAKRSALLAEKEAALAAAEEEWLRLEMLREELEA